MDLKDLAEYFAKLLRSDPEVIVAFLMGVLAAVILTPHIRRWMAPGLDPIAEFLRAELARKDLELADRASRLVDAEPRLADLEKWLSEERTLTSSLRDENSTLIASSGEIRERLEAENHGLIREKQAIEADLASLRARLKQAIELADHYERWWRLSEEENARLTEISS